jgi:hypothetical protein
MASCVPGELIPCAFVWHDPGITPCCRSLFAVLIKNSPGYRRDFRVKMWGASSPDNKLTGDFGSVIEATQSGDCRLVRIIAKKISPGNFRLLQQYLPRGDICSAAKTPGYSITSSAPADSPNGTSKPSILAVFRLITNSNLVACITGSSAGLSPLSTRPV